jgi:hypothetical protein
VPAARQRGTGDQAQERTATSWLSYFLGPAPLLFCFGFFGVFAFLSIAALRGGPSSMRPGHPVAGIDLPWEG